MPKCPVCGGELAWATDDGGSFCPNCDYAEPPRAKMYREIEDTGLKDIIGLWTVTGINAIDMSFKQAWRNVEDLESDASVPMMQKMMAKSAFTFEPDGRLLQLLPKELDDGGGYKAYDDRYVIGKESGWKEEDGKIFVYNEENSEKVWTEVVTVGDGIELFGFFRLSKDGTSRREAGIRFMPA